MKFSKSSQLFLVSSIGLLVATLLTACSITTIDIAFVASAAGWQSGTDGKIQTYAADSQSGALRPVASAVSTGGVRPVAMATTSDYANLYVANAGSNSITHFTIGLNGNLTAKGSVTLNDAPVGLAVDTAGTYLYVVSGTTSATLTEYSLSAGTIGSAATATIPLTLSSYPGDTMIPTGVFALANNNIVQGTGVYVSAYDQSAYNPGAPSGTVFSPAHPGWVFGFTAGSGGTLTAATGSPYQAGIQPSALVADPTNRFLYVTDYASAQLIGYTIMTGNTLSFLTNGPFKAGNEPNAIVIDPRGKFMYVTNALDNTVSGYDINLTTGTPTVALGASGSQLNQTDSLPVAIAIDPALGRFLYTANYLGGTISGFRMDPTAGSLSNLQASPYPTDQEPTAIIVIPHGNHASQTVMP
ncbi:MAG: beta-propeller fold lactonase family protein [Terracidiphilus sp.]|jgi:6-phosphogluconolactonase (cycloisomerase 2 family)